MKAFLALSPPAPPQSQPDRRLKPTGFNNQFPINYNARLDEALTEAVAALWRDAFKQLHQGTLNPAQLPAAIRTFRQEARGGDA